MMRVALKDSNNVIYFLNLRDEITNDPIIDATVTFALRDVYGNDVQGQAWPLNLTYRDGTNGDYLGILDNTIDLNVGHYYKGTITVVSGGTRLVEEHELEVVKKLP